MGGATIQCGTFEGNDKSGTPITSVLQEAFRRAFGRNPRGRLRLRLANLRGDKTPEKEAAAEAAILQVTFNEEGEIPADVSRLLLPYLQEYQASLLQQLKIEDEVEQIWKHVSPSIRAKYGKVLDPGWHLYCLHDLVPACKRSETDGVSVQVVW